MRTLLQPTDVDKPGQWHDADSFVMDKKRITISLLYGPAGQRTPPDPSTHSDPFFFGGGKSL